MADGIRTGDLPPAASALELLANRGGTRETVRISLENLATLLGAIESGEFGAEERLATASRDMARIGGETLMKLGDMGLRRAGGDGNPAIGTYTFNQSLSFRKRGGAVISTGTSYVHSAGASIFVEFFGEPDDALDFTFEADPAGAGLLEGLSLSEPFTEVDIAGETNLGGTTLRDLAGRALTSLIIDGSSVTGSLGDLWRAYALEVLQADAVGLTGDVKVFRGLTTLRRLLIGDNPLVTGDIGQALASATAFERLDVGENALLTLSSPADLPITNSVTRMTLNACTGLGLDDLTKGAAFATRIALMTRLNNVGLRDLGILTPNLDAIVIAIRTNADAHTINAGNLNISGNAGLSALGAAAATALAAAPRNWTITGT